MICSIQPDSQYAAWAFGNLGKKTPARSFGLGRDTSADSFPEIADEREATPIVGAAAGSDKALLLAVTTDIDRLFSPCGHIVGSDPGEYDYLFGMIAGGGVSGSKHVRLFIDHEEGQAENLTLQNLSKTSIKVISSRTADKQEPHEGTTVFGCITSTNASRLSSPKAFAVNNCCFVFTYTNIRGKGYCSPSLDAHQWCARDTWINLHATSDVTLDATPERVLARQLQQYSFFAIAQSALMMLLCPPGHRT